MSFSIDTNVIVSFVLVDAHTSGTFAWLGPNRKDVFLSDWTTTEFYGLLHRRVRAEQVAPAGATQASGRFDAFRAGRTRRLTASDPAGALAANLTRDPLLNLSAAYALHLALAATGGHTLVTFDKRLADAANARGYLHEIP